MVPAVIHGTEFRLVSDALASRSHRRPDTPGVPAGRFLFLLRPRWEADPRPDPTLLSQQEAQTRTRCSIPAVTENAGVSPHGSQLASSRRSPTDPKSRVSHGPPLANQPHRGRKPASLPVPCWECFDGLCSRLTIPRLSVFGSFSKDFRS